MGGERDVIKKISRPKTFIEANKIYSNMRESKKFWTTDLNPNN